MVLQLILQCLCPWTVMNIARTDVLRDEITESPKIIGGL